MTSKSKKILNALARLLGMDLTVGRRDIYVPQPVYFARGIHVERTPYRDCVYVRLLHLPFFSEFPVVTLDYSPRIASKLRSDADDYFEGTPEEIAVQIHAAIERERLGDALSALPGPAEFLDIIARSEADPSKPHVLFDRACCHALLGQRATAIELFTRAAERRRHVMTRFPPTDADHSELALNLLLSERLQRGEDITAELRRRCHANALALRFDPAPLPLG